MKDDTVEIEVHIRCEDEKYKVTAFSFESLYEELGKIERLIAKKIKHETNQE